VSPEDEGLSTPKKVAAGAALGLATAAAVGLGKNLLGSDSSPRETDPEDAGGDSSGAADPPDSASSKSRSSTTRRTGSTKMKEQLYAQAKRLKIEGRSRMTKRQLENAVSRKRT